VRFLHRGSARRYQGLRISYVESDLDIEFSLLTWEDSMRNMDYVDSDEGGFHIILAVIEHATRRIRILGATARPTQSGARSERHA